MSPIGLIKVHKIFSQGDTMSVMGHSLTIEFTFIINKVELCQPGTGAYKFRFDRFSVLLVLRIHNCDNIRKYIMLPHSTNAKITS